MPSYADKETLYFLDTYPGVGKTRYAIKEMAKGRSAGGTAMAVANKAKAKMRSDERLALDKQLASLVVLLSMARAAGNGTKIEALLEKRADLKNKIDIVEAIDNQPGAL